jgi:hypothetical protein
MSNATMARFYLHFDQHYFTQIRNSKAVWESMHTCKTIMKLPKRIGWMPLAMRAITTCFRFSNTHSYDYCWNKLHIWKLYFMLYYINKVLACIYFLLTFYQSSYPHIQKEEIKRKNKILDQIVLLALTCLNVLSTFVCLYTKWIIVEHGCSASEILLYTSFACCYSIKNGSFNFV